MAKIIQGSAPNQLWLCRLTVSEAHSKALAGVGRPIKLTLCRVSRLNLARRSAEKAAIKYAVKGRYAAMAGMVSGQLAGQVVAVSSSRSMANTMVAGAMPKVMSSARESSSLPMGEAT